MQLNKVAALLRTSKAAYKADGFADLGMTASRLNAEPSARLMSTSSDEAKQSELEHEKEGTSEAASWFKDGAKAVANSAKEKLGMGDGKEMSSAENMGPAGSMQQRDPSASQDEQYAAIKDHSRAQDKARSKDEDVPPNMQYPDHGKNAGA